MKLWQADYQPKETVPTLAELASAHLQLDRDTTSMIESAIEDDVRNNMYWPMLFSQYHIRYSNQGLAGYDSASSTSGPSGVSGVCFWVRTPLWSPCSSDDCLRVPGKFS
jgi:hypothetical protein